MGTPLALFFSFSPNPTRTQIAVPDDKLDSLVPAIERLVSNVARLRVCPISRPQTGTCDARYGRRHITGTMQYVELKGHAWRRRGDRARVGSRPDPSSPLISCCLHPSTPCRLAPADLPQRTPAEETEKAETLAAIGAAFDALDNPTPSLVARAALVFSSALGSDELARWMLCRKEDVMAHLRTCPYDDVVALLKQLHELS